MTNLQRHLPGEQLRAFGAATSVLPAASPLVEGVTGRCFEDCGEAAVVHERGSRARAGKSCTSGEAV